MLVAPAAAVDATWLLNPGIGNYNNGGNWSGGVVPNGIATFGVSNQNAVTNVSGSVGQWLFTVGASAYTFSILGGTLSFNGAGIQIDGGSATVDNIIGLVQFNNTSTAGSATFNNTDRLYFTANSSAGTATILNNGTVNFNNTSTAGNATIANIGTLNFNNTSTADSASIFNNGSILFLLTSTAGNARITNNSSLDFTANSTAGNATIVNNSFLRFGSLTTADNATITNNASLDFGGDANAGNATIDNRATLTFRDQSEAKNATITTASGATTFFQDNASGGNARMIIQSGGTVDIGNLTNGSTTFGSIEGAGNFQLEGNKGVVGSNNLSTIFSGVMSGNGSSFSKVGTGTLTLTGTSTYNNGTDISGGTLQVNGSIAASGFLSVNPGATLAGTGTVPFTFVDAGATLAPGPVGNGTGTLTINDRLVLCNCSNYAVKVASNGNDLAHIVPNFGLGDAALDGAVRVTSPTSSYRFKSPYTILTAEGGFIGGTQFASLTTPTGITGVLGYGSKDVFLTLTSALSGIGGLNQNQRAVANTLDKAFNSGGSSGALGGIFAGNIARNLTQASGEVATGTQTATFDAMGQFVSTMTDPFAAGRSGGGAGGATGYAPDDAMAYAKASSKAEKTPFARVFTKAPPMADAPRWNVWAAGFGGSQTTDGVVAVGSNTATSSIYGVAAGADYRFSPNTIAGFALAGGGTNFRTANLGSGRSDLFQAGGFIRHNIGAAYITAAAAYGWQDVTTDRTLTIAGVDRLRANFNSNALTGRIESGYRFVSPFAGGIGLTPYAAGQSTAIFLPTYVEAAIAGANTFALAFASRDVTNTRSELGLRADKSFVMDTAILTLRGRAAWAHNFNPDRSINATFQSLPGASFTMNGAAASRDTALTTASAELRWLSGWSVAGTFEGEFSDRTRSYAGKGLVRYVW